MRTRPITAALCGAILMCLTTATGGSGISPRSLDPQPERPPQPSNTQDRAAPAWPTFQHSPRRTGAVERPAIEEPAVAWSTRVGICGYLNNAVIVGDRVFVPSSGSDHNEPDPLDGVHALDLRTGATLWHAPTLDDACGLSYHDGLLYLTSDDGFVRCIDPADGRVQWSRQFDHALYAPPLCVDRMVIVDDGVGGILALDAEFGGTLWHSQTHGDVVRGALTTDGQRVFAAFRNGRVCALNLSDGGMRWSAWPINRDFEIYGSPTLAGPVLLITYARDTTYRSPAMLALDPRTGRVVWAHNDAELKGHPACGNLRASPALWGVWALIGEPYSNELRAYAVGDGGLDFAVPLGHAMFPHWPSPVVVGDTCYLPRHDGLLYAVDLVKRELKWRFYLGDHAKLSPAPPMNLMPDAWPDIAWAPAVGQPLYASPAIAHDGSILIGTGDGYLHRVTELDAAR